MEMNIFDIDSKGHQSAWIANLRSLSFLMSDSFS